MTKIFLIILTIFFTFTPMRISEARVVRDSFENESSTMDYYKSLRNILAKYITFRKSKDLMRGFGFNLKIYNQNSPKIQKVCEEVRKAVLKLEDPRVNSSLITYFINTVLAEFQKELYNFSDPKIYGEVLNIIVNKVFDSVKNGIVLGSPENLYKDIVIKLANRDDDIGAFFAQLFNRLYAQPPNFKEMERGLQNIILNDNYSVHTKHQILVKAFEKMVAAPDDISLGNVYLELLVSGVSQSNLYIKAFSICRLAKICCEEGFSQNVRIFAFESALAGLKSIPWDIYFDRNKKAPEEVNYIVVCIDYLIDAEKACHEYGIDIDLAEDEEFVQIYDLLLLDGFDLEFYKGFVSKN